MEIDSKLEILKCKSDDIIIRQGAKWTPNIMRWSYHDVKHPIQRFKVKWTAEIRKLAGVN